MFKPAFEFVETYEASLQVGMAGLELARAEGEFKFCHFQIEWPLKGLIFALLAVGIKGDNVCETPTALSS